jgi:hypothetical protein
MSRGGGGGAASRVALAAARGKLRHENENWR